ncbi:MAG: copper-translocating P-type ATPase [candidate division WOR-3 bacterium]|nr:copper-translocating P-type ATPase [candidate division WOR-3 bacterium]
MEKLFKLPVKGVDCVSCARAIKNIAKNYSDIEIIDVDITSSTITIKLENGYNFKKLNQELAEFGYKIITQTYELYVSNMDENLENFLKNHDLVINFGFDQELRIIRLEVSNDVSELIREIRNLGYRCYLINQEKSIFDIEYSERVKELKKLKYSAIISSVIAFPLLLHEFGLNLNPIFQMVLAIPIQFYFGLYFIKNAYKSLRAGNLDMNVLISLGTLSAFFASFLHFVNPHVFHHVYFSASGIIISVILLGKYFEERAKFKVFENLRSLYTKKPKKVLLETNKEIDIFELSEGDVFILKEGFISPADGIVVEGEGIFDESAFSGESFPIKKSINDFVYQGTMLKSGYVKVKAINVKNTIFNEIIRISRYEIRERTKLESIADRVSAIFIPVVLTFAIVVFFFWYVFFNNFELALLSLISVLVIACPCAIGIAIPLVIARAINIGLKKGIIIKNSKSLENANLINVVVFDKTGTLTESKLTISSYIPEEHLKYLASAEKLVSHPISNAILNLYKGNDFYEVSDFEYIKGEGIKARVNNRKLLFGNRKLFFREGFNVDFDFGYFIEGYGSFSITFENEIKKDAKVLISELRKKYRVIVLSGDSYENVRKVCEKLGIDEFYSNLSPFEKADFIESLKKNGNKVLYVGDGINDAIALSKADLSIAVSNAIDIAKESGDIVLFKNDISSILKAFSISKTSAYKMRWNLFWTFIYNIILIPFAGGLYFILFNDYFNPIWSAFAMAISDIIVVYNAIYNWKD